MPAHRLTELRPDGLHHPDRRRRTARAAGARRAARCCSTAASTSPTPAAGERAYAAGHLPGAHLRAPRPRPVGRPRATAATAAIRCPSAQRFAATVGALGHRARRRRWWPTTRQGGPYAARAWWLLRWLGHEAVAVLDGGAARPGRGRRRARASAPCGRRARPPYPAAATPAMPTIDADALLARARPACACVDARAGERFRGEVEPLDPVAGHIPGATQPLLQGQPAAPTAASSPRPQLRAEFDALGDAAPARSCTSAARGVTACHNLLAMAHAGLDGLACCTRARGASGARDPSRPVARG
ncbi:MAG: sulfurtransferase [Comamonadaceae bacterium]|nr:sulfurtransferase [Comamonadaceae bacterium]